MNKKTPRKNPRNSAAKAGRDSVPWARVTASESGPIKLPPKGGKAILKALQEPISADEADFLVNEMDTPGELKKFIKKFWEETTTVIYRGRTYVVKIGRYLIALIGRVWNWLLKEVPHMWNSLKKHYPRTVSLVLLFVILVALAHLVPIIGGIVAGLLAAVGAAIAALSAVLETMEDTGVMQAVRQGLRVCLVGA